MKILEVFIPQDKAWYRLFEAAEGDTVKLTKDVLTRKWQTPEGQPVVTTFHLSQFAAYSLV